MPGFLCGHCGRWRSDPPRDVAFGLPDAVFEMPAEERAERAWISSDICVLDEQAHFVRGVLYVPIRSERGRIGWGVWAHVARRDFERYLDAWGTQAELAVPPFAGHLANEIQPYPGSMGLEVTVRLQGGAARPSFTLTAATHQLGADQRQAITPEQANEQMSLYHGVNARTPAPWAERVRSFMRHLGTRRCRCGSEG